MNTGEFMIVALAGDLGKLLHISLVQVGGVREGSRWFLQGFETHIHGFSEISFGANRQSGEKV